MNKMNSNMELASKGQKSFLREYDLASDQFFTNF